MCTNTAVKLFLATCLLMLAAPSASPDLIDLGDWATQLIRNLVSDDEPSGTNELDQELQEILAEFKRSADQIYDDTLARTKEIYKLSTQERNHHDTRSHRRRQRRSADDRDEDGILDELEDVYYLSRIEAIVALDVSSSFDIVTFTSDNVLYFIATNGTTAETQDEVKLFSWDDVSTSLTLVQTLTTADVFSITPIYTDNDVYLAVAESNSDEDWIFSGTVIYKFDTTLLLFTQIQRIWTSDARTVATIKIDDVPYIFIGAWSSVIDSEGVNQEMSASYKWLGGHFDQFGSYATHNVTDIHCFTIHGLHFTAIANYGDLEGNTVINSEILVYSRSLHEMEHIQYIETNGAVDWEYFGFGESRHREHFLAVVNNPDSNEEQESMIYKYHNGLFVTFQCILTTGATKWHAITDEKDDLILLALATVSGVKYYEYTGWWFRLTDVQYSGPFQNISTFGLTSVYWNNTFLLGVAGESDLDESSHIFQLSFTQYSPLGERHAELEASCEALQVRLHNLTQEVEGMQNRSKDLVYINSVDEQWVRGSINLTMNITVQNIEVNKVYANSGVILSEDGMKRLAAVKSLTSNHSSDINELMDTWDNNTMKIYGDQTVTGEKEFSSISVTNSMTVDSLMVESGIINSDISLHDLDNNTARTDRTQTFISPITVSNQVTVQGDLMITGEIDEGVVTSEVVTLSGDHTITAQKHFQNVVTIKGNLDVDGTVDGIDVSNESLLLATNDQTFTGSLKFLGDLYYKDDVAVDGLVAGVDLHELKEQAVYQNGVHNITGNKYFNGDVTVTTGVVVAVGYRIDGVDIEVLNDTSMRLSIEQRITGELSFTQDVSIVGNLQITGTINDLYIPDSVLICDSAEEVTITGALTFDTDVTFNNLWCTETIDGISCQVGGSGLDIMLLAGNQDVSGSITFLDMWLDGSSLVSGLIDGVDVPALAADAVYDEGDQIITGNKTIDGTVTFDESITINGLLNGVNLTKLDEKALKVTDGELQPESQLIFQGPVTFEQVLVTDGNHSLGYNLTLPDLVTQGSLEDVRGVKTVTRDVLSGGYFNVTGHVNGIYLQDFYRDVVKTTGFATQELTANFTFTEDVVIEDDLRVSRLIDGVNINKDIVNVNGTQVIYGETAFTRDLVAYTLSVNGSLVITGLLNGVNVSDLALNTLQKSGDQHISGTKTFQDGRLVFGDNMTIDGLLSGVNITELVADAVYKTGNHMVTGKKTFESQAQIQRLDVTGVVDGVDIDSLFSDTVQQNKNQTITGSNMFTGDVTIETDLTVLGDINGYDLQDRVSYMVFITNETVDVEIHFSNVSSDGDVDIGSEIDTIDVSQEAVLTNAPDQVITGVKTLQGLVTLQTHLHADTVCGIDISVLEQTIVYDDGNQVITGHKLFTDELVILGDLRVDGLIDGVNVTNLAQNAMRTEDETKSEQRVTADASMENLNVYEVVYYNGTLDGVDLVHLNQTYLSRTQPQTINASKTFSDTVQIASSGTLQGDNGITLQGYINGIDLGEFAEGVWLSGQLPTINGLKTFHTDILVQGDIHVGGFVDGIDIRNNLLLTNVNSIVTGYKTFSDDVIVQSSILVDAGLLVDGVDVSDWNLNAARLTDNYEISITISISDVTLEQNLIVGELTDNIPLNFDGVLVTVTDQVVTGHKSFVQNVVIEGALNVDRFINGIDVVELLTDTLLASRPQDITGNYTIAEHPTFVNVTTLGLVYDVRIPDLYQQIHTYPPFDMLNASLLSTCEIVDRIKGAQDNTAVILQHLAVLQEIPTTGYGRWHGYEYRGVQWLVEGKQTEQHDMSCANLYVYYWNDTVRNFVLESSLDSIMTSDIDTFERDDRLYMVVGSLSNVSIDCFNGNTPRTLDAVSITDPDGITTLMPATLPSSFPSGGTTSILLRSNTTSEVFLFQQLPSVSITSDIETFVDPITSQQCVAIGNEIEASNGVYDSLLHVYVYCMDNVTSGFYFKQAIPTFAVKKVSHFFVNDILHLAIVNHVDTGANTFLTSSAIWWQTSEGDFAELDTVATSAAIDVAVIDVEDSTYVVFASEFEGTYGHEDYNVPLEIYQYTVATVPSLVWKQSIPTQGVISLGQFLINGQSFLVVLDRVDTITVYKYNGIRFFEEVHLITVSGAVSLEVITMPYVYTERILIAVMVYGEEPTLFGNQQARAVLVSSLLLEVIIEGDKLDTTGCTDV